MKMKKLTALALSLLMLFSLCACGSSAKTQSAESAYYSEASYAPVPAPAAAYGAAYEMDAAPEEAAFGMSNAAVRREAGDEAGADVPESNPEKIIYSADATVETTEFDKCTEDLEALLAECGGFVEASSVNGSNYYDTARGNVSRRTASYTLRIPSDRFGGLMDSLSTLGSVPYTHMYTENVTSQYYDVQARLKALQAQETRLVEMLEIAETVEDIITIEDKLSDVRYRIDALQSNLNNWDRRVSYSTLNLTVKEVQVYTPETPVHISYGQRLVRAFTGALKNVGVFFQDLLVFLVSALPALAILALLFFVCRPLLKKWFAKGKERRARRAAEKAAKKALKAQPSAPSEPSDKPQP